MTGLIASELQGMTDYEAQPVDFQMYDLYDSLARELRDKSMQDPGKQVLIAIAGPPGGGKSSTAKAVAFRLKVVYGIPTIVLPMDGYHFSKKELDGMHGSTELHNRRGAHWTFNIERLIEDIRNLRWIGEGSFPSFDHHIGDPIEDAIKVEPAHRIVLVEGNYLLLYDVSPWDKLASLFDMKLYLSCDLAVTRTRLIKRHMSTGDTQERAIYKADSNDVKNGELVQSCSIKYADKVLASR